ncbi:unnamed protein product, partial [Leptidea sinapis]
EQSNNASPDVLVLPSQVKSAPSLLPSAQIGNVAATSLNATKPTSTAAVVSSTQAVPSVATVASTVIKSTSSTPQVLTSSVTRDRNMKMNGDSKARKEMKNFRIGSARRVEACGLVNGDGDPDFGTPV